LKGLVNLKHNTRRFRAVAVPGLGLAALFVTVQLQAQVSLSTVVELAQRNSSAVKLAQADVRKAAAVLSQTKDVYIPDLVVGSTIGPPSIGFPTGQPSIANASMQSLVWSFPQRKYIEAARVGYRAASLSLKDALEQMALEASTAYIELDTVDNELEAARQQSTFAVRLVNIESERSEAGVDPLSELLQARLTAAQLNLKLLHLQTRAATLVSQLASFTGLPATSVAPDHASIPRIPEVKAAPALTVGIESAQLQARSKQIQASGDALAGSRPQIAFGAQYNRDSTVLNNYADYYTHFKADNLSAGFTIQIPLFDLNHRAKARETAADALRATVEAEQAQHQNDIQIATLTANLRELDALAEIASLKQQIAGEQLKTVQSQIELGNGSGTEPGAMPQTSPKAEQLARIDERQKFVDALDAGFDLSKTRLSLLRALGHMEDWLSELHTKEPATVSK
jgi:outer membrane protein TolC